MLFLLNPLVWLAYCYTPFSAYCLISGYFTCIRRKAMYVIKFLYFCLPLFLNCKKEFFVWTDLKDHLTFTNFLIKITDGEEKCIIVEVKNVLAACDLNIQCNKVAQVLRQAQIIIQDMKLNDVTFVLTNSIDWSFWMAKKKGDKIEVA